MSNQYQYLWARIAGPDPNLRAADADRERVAERLRRAHGEGRLDLAEFQERLDRCYQAKTVGQLRELVADLPREEVQAAPRSFAAVRQWSWRAPLVPLLIGLIVISAAAGHGHHVFWFWVPLVFLFWRLASWRRRSWTGPRHRSQDWL